eukprot:5999948-Amphidinium_carterae.2
MAIMCRTVRSQTLRRCSPKPSRAIVIPQRRLGNLEGGPRRAWECKLQILDPIMACLKRPVRALSERVTMRPPPCSLPVSLWGEGLEAPAEAGTLVWCGSERREEQSLSTHAPEGPLGGLRWTARLSY